jgi:hypothetical protein
MDRVLESGLETYSGGGVLMGIAALCVTLVWATQEGRVARPLGRHRRIPRHGPHKPWKEMIRQMMECVGTWLMMISVPQAEPSQGAERRRTCANPEGRSSSSTYREAAPRQGHQNGTRLQEGSTPRQGTEAATKNLWNGLYPYLSLLNLPTTCRSFGEKS